MKTIENIDGLLLELSQNKIKLWLEGDRLRYKAPKDALTPELLAQVKDRKPEIIDFLRTAANSTSTELPQIERIDRSGKLPLSFAQQKFWFLHQFEPESSANNMPVVVKIEGSLKIDALESAVSEVVRRHEVLRTSFPAENGQPYAVITPPEAIDLPVIDLRDFPEDERDAKAFDFATQTARKPFDLAQESMLRVELYRLRDDEYIFIWNLHCIVCDGASSDVFYQDLLAIYAAFAAGKPNPLPELSIQYVDFAHWQRQWLQGEVLESQLNYWKRQLEDLPAPVKLPQDRPRPKGALTYKGDRQALMLPKTLNAKLNQFSQKQGITLFTTLLTVFEVLLYRYSGQENILLSFASSGRGQVETERLIGFFSNTLMLRSELTGNLTFTEALKQTRQTSLEAIAHQDLPFEKLVEEIKPSTKQERSSLFQIKFALNPPWSDGRGMASVKLSDVTFTSLFGYIYHGKTKYDLTLVMREQDEGLGMVFDYNADIFDKSTVDKMLEHFRNLLEAVVRDPECRIQDLPMLATGEQLPQSKVIEIEESKVLPHNQPILAASDEIESKLVEIWQSVLGIESISIKDNYFELGGNSLLAVKVFAQIEEKLGKVLPLSLLIKAPTIEKLAKFIRKSEISEEWSPLVQIQSGKETKPKLFCVHGGGFNILVYRDLALLMGEDYPVYALQARGLSGESDRSWLNEVEDIAKDYIREIQKVQPEGPYLLSGLSKGGITALEIAQQLKAQGHEVALLAMYDTNSPQGIELLPLVPRFFSAFYYLVRYSSIRWLSKKVKSSIIFKLVEKRFGKILGLDRANSIKTQMSQDPNKKMPITKYQNKEDNALVAWMNQFSIYVLERSPWAFFSPSAQLEDTSDSASQNLMALEKLHQEMYENYKLKPYFGKIVLFKATEFPPGYRRDALLGWGDIALKGVKKHMIRGTHISLLKSPALAKIMSQYVDDIEQQKLN